ncbi:hypothetical protein VN93_1450 [Lactococcus cremoris]|uniref:Uncharacterized protein n=1 Tax=Lactococcus lactis subsp. cremoris TaxID=1359 RepID=A0ABR5EG77_LACLC|nr:hypothetical protein VN93_1450 [Lactococcus cremoris]
MDLKQLISQKHKNLIKQMKTRALALVFLYAVHMMETLILQEEPRFLFVYGELILNKYASIHWHIFVQENIGRKPHISLYIRES